MGPSGGKIEQSGLYVLAAKDIFHTLLERQREEFHAMKEASIRLGANGTSDPIVSIPPSSTETIFRHCSLFVSYYEIYSGKIFDLLHSRRRLVCRSDAVGGVHVIGLKERKCKTVTELMELIQEGNNERSTGQTGANIDSSRSHAILAIALKQIVPMNKNQPAGSRLSRSLKGKYRLKTQGKFSFIDLAGESTRLSIHHQPLALSV